MTIFCEDLVSIIIPVYNAEKFLEKTIDSVLAQTYENFELILINDQSTDRSEEIVKDYESKDNRVKGFNLSENSGAAVARNTGLEKAKGQFIAFIDSDDMWKENKLAEQLSFMKRHNYSFTYTLFQPVDEEGEVSREPAKLPFKLNYSALLKNTAIACSTVVIDRNTVGDFRMPLVRKGQDTATWLKLLKTIDYAYLVPEVLGFYRSREGSLSNNKIQALKRTWNIYYNVENLSLTKSIYYFLHYVINAIRRRI